MKNIFAKSFPYINQWIEEQGWIEIGQDEYSKSLVRAIDAGGMVWESKKQHVSVDEALGALERFLIKLSFGLVWLLLLHNVSHYA